MGRDWIQFARNLDFKLIYVSRDNLIEAHNLASKGWARGKMIQTWC